jgi:shikimate dehydrogenase
MDALKKIQSIQADILINTTPVGMSPNIDDSAFPARLLDSHMLVMDIVYNPLETKLLRDAKTRGCKIIDGLSMFLHQGRAQFKLWTGITPDLELMRHTIMNGEF